MPHDNDLRVADVMGDAAIASEIPEFNLDHDTGEEAGPYQDDSHVIEGQATTVYPAKRRKTAIISALALVAILLIASFAFLHRGNQAQQPQNPDLAAIIQEAKTVPPLGARKGDNLNTPVKAPVAAPPAALPTQQSVPTDASVPLQATSAPAASSEPAKAKSTSTAPAANVSNALVQTPGVTQGAAVNPAVVSKADYDKLVSERDAIAKQLDKAQADIAALKTEKATASTKEIVKVPERESFTIRAVLADGVVLQNNEGKTLIAQTGARVTVDGKAMAVSR